MYIHFLEICAWSFHLIGYFLVWKIGNGAKVCIGMDPWVGCKWRQWLPSHLIDFLHSAGYFFFKDVGTLTVSYLMEQGWLSSDDLGLVENLDINAWNGYLTILKSSHIRLRNEEDVLVWNEAKSNKYSPKVEQMHLILEQHEREIEWWWNMFWHMKCPLKSKIFVWSLFSGKALTWDFLNSRGWEGPRRCYLCKCDVETNLHLGVDCPYTKSVQKEIEAKVNIQNLWVGDSILSCLKNWVYNTKVQNIRSLPIIVFWFIWKSRNRCYFDNQNTSPAQVSAFSPGLLSSYPLDTAALKIRISTKEVIDKTKP